MTSLTVLEPLAGVGDLSLDTLFKSNETTFVDDSLGEVLKWVKLDTDDHDLIDRVAGVTDTQSAYLTRLSALVLVNLDRSGVPIELLDALTPSSAISVPTAAKEAFRRLLAVDPITSLAALYAETVAAANRRTLGTFFTPRAEATTMVQEYAGRFSAPTHIVDVGAGVGVFSDAARTMWPDAVVDAIDINPVTLGLQAAALASIGNGPTTLFLEDFAAWIANFTPDGPTLYLGNPPYTRWQLIPAAERTSLLEAAGGLVDARANLSTIFLAITLKKLRSQDALSLIVPASWMEARYAKTLRAFVREQRYRPITLRFADSWRFENAIVDAVVVEIGPESSTSQSLRITDWPGTTAIELTRMKGDQTAFRRLSENSIDPRAGTRLTDTRLGDIAKVSRGVATGSNKFFVLTVDDTSERGIAAKWSVPLARRLRRGASADTPLIESALLLTLGGYRTGDDPVIDALTADGEKNGVHEGHLCGQRPRWFDLSAEIKRPDVILTSLGRDSFHFHENTQNFAITNNLFGLQWLDCADARQRQHTLTWLRSDEGQQALIQSSATEANGLHRLSPRAMEELRVPPNDRQSSLQPVRDEIDITGDTNASS